MVRLIYSVSEYERVNTLTCIMTGLPQSLGNTIGNSIRRTILATTPGIAVYGFKCSHLQHALDKSIYLVEGALDITNNLKCVVFKYDPEFVDTSVVIQRTTAGKITAGDLEDISEGRIQAVHRDLAICTLSDDIEFSIEIFVRQGSGFTLHDHNKEAYGSDETFIGVTSIYSRIENVNFVNRPQEITDVPNSESITITATYPKCYDGKVIIEHAIKYNLQTYQELLDTLYMPEQSLSQERDFRSLVLDIAYAESTSEIYELLLEAQFENLATLEQILNNSEVLKNAKIKKKHIKEFIAKTRKIVHETQ